MLNKNREFFATLGIIMSWLAPLVVFFLLLPLPPVRDLLTAFAFFVAIYSTFQLYRWGNYRAVRPAQPARFQQPREVDSRQRLLGFLDSLTGAELQELKIQVEQRLSQQAEDLPE
ncbi:MAG: hypothetical protein H7X77_02430 [Anaerolineae bacterium]|nr:hypothetical protein [Anaerolineae bacterium]